MGGIKRGVREIGETAKRSKNPLTPELKKKRRNA